MASRRTAIILFATVWVFMTIYAPQPLLPLLADYFGIAPDRSALLITATLLPLGIAPIAYGYLLEAVPARLVLLTATALLALLQLPFLWAESFWTLLATRLGQGLLLPAILTAAMAYLSANAEPAKIRATMSIYVAATIAGGFGGRLLAGALAEYGHWRWGFLLLALGLAAAFLLLLRLPRHTPLKVSRVNPRLALDILRQPGFGAIYAIIFLVFFCFASLLNFLPFQLSALAPTLTPFHLGLVYAGYLIGIVTALSAVYIASRLGGEANGIIAGLSLYAVATLSFAIPSAQWCYIAMWLFCAGMFLVHALLSGYLNHLTERNHGVVNGLYVAAYYLGGTLGSFAPGPIYFNVGWGAYVGVLTAMLALAIAIAFYLRRVSAAVAQRMAAVATPRQP